MSYDGTWRGFSSQYGVGVAIDILTGLVIDFELLSLYCHGCAEADNKEWSGGARERLLWEEKHAPDCCKNYTGSSKAMETEAAKRIWLRSVEKYNLRYTEMLSDGDSTAFKALHDLQPYGDIVLSKLECVNHAHKRMGTALRKLTKQEKLGGQGEDRLTVNKCDILQSYYRTAIQNNLGNLDDMKNAVLATLHHSMSATFIQHMGAALRVPIHGVFSGGTRPEPK